MHETPEPDVSESMGAEDYALSRPYRGEQAPSPQLYNRGWATAVAEEASLAEQQEGQ